MSQQDDPERNQEATYSWEAAEAYACKVCGNRPDEDGWLDHGRGCYALGPDGGGSELVDVPWCPAA